MLTDQEADEMLVEALRLSKLEKLYRPFMIKLTEYKVTVFADGALSDEHIQLWLENNAENLKARLKYIAFTETIAIGDSVIKITIEEI